MKIHIEDVLLYAVAGVAIYAILSGRFPLQPANAGLKPLPRGGPTDPWNRPGYLTPSYNPYDHAGY